MTLDSVTVQFAPACTLKVTEPPLITVWLEGDVVGVQLALTPKLSGPSGGTPGGPVTVLRTVNVRGGLGTQRQLLLMVTTIPDVFTVTVDGVAVPTGLYIGAFQEGVPP